MNIGSMKSILQITVSIVIDTTDDTSIVTPSENNPLDELAERLRREMAFGRDVNQRPINPPKVLIGTAVTCQGCSDQN